MTELEFVNLVIQHASSAQSATAVKACDTILRLALDRRKVIGKQTEGTADGDSRDG